MPEALQIALGGLLIAGVLGGVTSGVFLAFGLIARRARPELGRHLLRRAAQLAIGLGILTIVYPVAGFLLGRAWTSGSWSLVTAGLLLLAYGTFLRGRLR
jgi:hypothetical protein